VFTFWPYVWQLDPGHTYNERLVLALKPDVTEWYQSQLNHKNAILDGRVILKDYFMTKTIFTSSLFKGSILLLIFCYLALLAHLFKESFFPFS
jgi:hypothetical protein